MKFSTAAIVALFLFSNTYNVLGDDILLYKSTTLKHHDKHHGLRRRLSQVMNTEDIVKTIHDDLHKKVHKSSTGFLTSSKEKNKYKNLLWQEDKIILSTNNDKAKEAAVVQRRSLTGTGTCWQLSDCSGVTSTGKSITDCYHIATSGIGPFATYGYEDSDGNCTPLGVCWYNYDICLGPYSSGANFYTVEHCINVLNGDSWSSNPPVPIYGNTDICISRQEFESGGDPHFNVWNHKKKFSYHGECDLVLIQNPTFHNDCGLELHIRTTRVSNYSFIESAALKIGSDTMQVDSNGDFKVNSTPGEMFNTTKASLFGGFEFSHWHSGKEFYHLFRIDFDNLGGKLEFKVFEGIIYVSASGGIRHLFKGSHGMSGDADTGNMLGRDGTTFIDDPTEYALEWQVRNDVDANLFDIDRPPQWPEKCSQPNKFIPRLSGDGTSISREEAELVCAHLPPSKKDDCIFDVMATGNNQFGNLKDIDREADFGITSFEKEKVNNQ